MGECVCVPTCPFFNDKMVNMPAVAGMMKRRYCMDDFSHCARFMVREKLGKENVPADLFPSQTEKAMQLIGGKT
jgi:hypothetical protein